MTSLTLNMSKSSAIVFYYNALCLKYQLNSFSIKHQNGLNLPKNIYLIVVHYPVTINNLLMTILNGLYFYL